MKDSYAFPREMITEPPSSDGRPILDQAGDEQQRSIQHSRIRSFDFRWQESIFRCKKQG